MSVRLIVILLWIIWLAADLVVLQQCSGDVAANLRYLTSWSHIASLIAHHPILLYLCISRKSTSYTIWCTYIFCASGVLLAAILVTFFVVVVIDDELFSERVDASTLPHYKHHHSGAHASPLNNVVYFEARGFSDFTSIGTMVTYNNIRHVLPAVLHLLITMEVPFIRSELNKCSSMWIACLAILLPVVHFSHNGPDGERSLYRADPLIPGLTLVGSLCIATFYYKNLGSSQTRNKDQQDEADSGSVHQRNDIIFTPVIRL
jgi:hypothetical protein